MDEGAEISDHYPKGHQFVGNFQNVFIFDEYVSMMNFNFAIVCANTVQTTGSPLTELACFRSV